MLPKDWLQQFLTSRHMDIPDGCPLYRYRMSDDEFKTLKAALKTSASLGITNILKFSGSFGSWSAAFVIYAAEWWRQEYDGSVWSWEKVFASFSVDGKELKAEYRNLIVEKGLRYWQREVRVINGNSRYLGTIATEGGLPLNQLNKSSGWLGRVFKQVIPKYTRLQQTGTDANQLVAECEYIPLTYQNSQIYTILGDMVTTVVKLKQEHRLHECGNPVSYLDQHSPSWRELFPLPIATEVGERLLSDMITAAAKADDTLTLPLRSVRRLQDDGSVQLQLEFAGFIALETLGLPDNITGRLEVELIVSDSKPRQLDAALKTDYQHKPSLKMPRSPAAITGVAALQGYAIRFKHLSETFKEIPLIGAERLDNDVPWVFVQRDDSWALEGFASVSTRAKLVRVLYPCHWTCVDSETQGLATVLPDKKLLEASGIIRLIDDDANTFVIKTAQERAAGYYYLQGKLLGFTSVPNELYLGLPILRRADTETGTAKDIPASQLTARAVNGKGVWLPLTQSLQGVYELRLCEQGAIVFRKKCVLLPERFTVRFKPSATSLDGAIYLDHTGNAEVVCETPIKHAIIPDAEGYCIDLFAEQTPPSQVRVTLRWQGMIEMVTLTLPFPGRGGQVINANEDRQSAKQPLFQDQLHGIRLRLFNEQPERKRHLRIEFMLVDDGGVDELRDVYFRDQLERKGAVIELAIIDYLDWIKTLLAVSSNLDSFVQLAIDENGSELLRIKISRYPFSLQRNLEQGTVELKENDHIRLSWDMLNGIELMAMRLSQPEQEHIRLEPRVSEHTETGCWFFHPEKRVAEPWLIYPAKTSSVPLRPILWAVDYEPGNSYHLDAEISTLHSAVKMGQTQARHDAIKSILEQMCLDFSHSGWDYLRQLWRHCPHLPLSSFDVWTIAVTDTRLLTALVLQMDAAFSQKLSEELPVLWELVPLHDWQAVFVSYQQHLQQQGMELADANEILTMRIAKLSDIAQTLDVIEKLLKQSLLSITDQELSRMKCLPLDSMINEQRQSLDRRQAQADSNWPTFLKTELLGAWQELKPAQHFGLDLRQIAEHHHAVVVLPVLLASFCAETCVPETWSGNATVIFQLKRLKAFDEEWFNTVFKWALAYLSQQNQ